MQTSELETKWQSNAKHFTNLGPRTTRGVNGRTTTIDAKTIPAHGNPDVAGSESSELKAWAGVGRGL
jgi:hypothetical protein